MVALNSPPWSFCVCGVVAHIVFLGDQHHQGVCLSCKGVCVKRHLRECHDPEFAVCCDKMVSLIQYNCQALVLWLTGPVSTPQPTFK